MHRPPTLGIITYAADSPRRTDYLYRLSLKCLIRNADGEILVVKESGRDYWDLPGGGMDHGEDIRSSIAREMQEEVNLTGDFTYRVIAVDEPARLDKHNFWQVRLVFEVTPEVIQFSAGEDGDEISFTNPRDFAHAANLTERAIFHYSQAAAA